MPVIAELWHYVNYTAKAKVITNKKLQEEDKECN